MTVDEADAKCETETQGCAAGSKLRVDWGSSLARAWSGCLGISLRLGCYRCIVSVLACGWLLQLPKHDLGILRGRRVPFDAEAQRSLCIRTADSGQARQTPKRHVVQRHAGLLLHSR